MLKSCDPNAQRILKEKLTIHINSKLRPLQNMVPADSTENL
jgi:hypothetical protein